MTRLEETPSLLNAPRIQGDRNCDVERGLKVNQIANNDRYSDTFKDKPRHDKNREMSSSQEVWNAITMIPYPLFFIFLIVTGSWLSEEDIYSVKEALRSEESSNLTQIGPEIDDSCIHSSLFPTFHALPPAPVLCAAIGIIAHTPFSIIYHILCAWCIPPGPKRIDHLSRRLDQAMIHFISTCWCYASSANLAYSFCALIFNTYSSVQLFSKRAHKPKQVIGRMVLCFLLPMLPLLARGEFFIFFQLFCIHSLSFWLFANYPLGGKHEYCTLLLSNHTT